MGKTLDVESNAVVGGKLSVFYGLAVARASQFGGTMVGRCRLTLSNPH
jgi:hypothetical protein